MPYTLQAVYSMHRRIAYYYLLTISFEMSLAQRNYFVYYLLVTLHMHKQIEAKIHLYYFATN